jgi:ubiquinone/menaquinone biosynthesis C-methylase UbiE
MKMEKLKRAVAYPPSLLSYLQKKGMFLLMNPFWDLVTRVRGLGVLPAIKISGSNQPTAIDQFWSKNTVYAPSMKSAFHSRMNLEWRFRAHPMFKELTNLYGDHQNELILDYGCGPGNDLVGFACNSRARKIIGMDISHKSLELAAHRLALHKIDPERVELIQIHDANPEIDLPDEALDFISCQGVLMHTSQPEKILAEFFRILKPNSNACVMVYSQPSIWFNLYTAYEQMIVRNVFSGLGIDEAFSRNTDGSDCPMARCYPIEEFIQLCKGAGFQCNFAGGYLTETEMISLTRYLKPALKDQRLDEIHRQYLRKLMPDDRGYPKYQGYYAGVSGVYHLYKK